MKTFAPLNLTVCRPDTEDGQNCLAQWAAEAHAEAVIWYIRSLPCPPRQKTRLLDAVIAAAKNSADSKTHP